MIDLLINFQLPVRIAIQTGIKLDRARNAWHRNTERETRDGIPQERWRGWPRTENNGVPWSFAYADSEQTGISIFIYFFICQMLHILNFYVYMKNEF